jgi:hypothetical protein
MRPSGALFAAMIVWSGSLAAQAQSNNEGATPPKERSAHHFRHDQRVLSHDDRAQVRGHAGRGPSTTGSGAGNDAGGGAEVILPSVPKGRAGGPLPNDFKNCEEPIVPRFCPP